MRSRPRRHVAGIWVDRIGERLTRPRAIDAAGQIGSVVVLGGAIVLGVVLGGHGAAFGDGVLRVADHTASALGLRITSVEIAGNEVLDDQTILDTAGMVAGTSLIGIDANRARARLEALPWIASARVQKFFPSTLAVDVVERVPYAVWQHDGQFHIIDRTGVLLRPASVDQLPELPVIVGKGAADNAAALFAELAKHPEIAGAVIASVRVANRRWTLHLDRGIEVRLPEDGIGDALARLAELAGTQQLLRRDIDLVDMRIDGRIFVRPRTGEKAEKVARAGVAS
ncbi:MAG: FtsQ-type POTRA domain-containing protein [Rhodobiaceae bacterium]|nr:FtsQ-type POTRA domain-containing protein [Rhodobiaceae bacterium]MCC0040862.1 FtsQ-type POTRA domain-containing protein [Rhodobiaceae bacterium]MCC0053688.1 FtsQ-type POTRA domain-containing protein [Rhodobiaceae bacterium]